MTEEQQKALAAMPFEQKVQFLFGQFASLTRDLGLDMTVAYVAQEGMHAAARWPTCGDACQEPESCTANVFRSVAADLIVQAKRIDNGTADLRVQTSGGDA